MDKPNGKQLEFINHSNGSVLLSASAGSGKTTTMVSKLVKLIAEDRVPLKNILTLTFTRAAANEMRQKLYLGLSEKLASNPQDTFVAEQMEYLNLADIGTIDSLCNKLVKKYFYVIGIDPSFEIMSEQEENYLLTKTIEKVCLELRDSQDYFELYESYLSHRSSAEFYKMIMEVYKYLLVMPEYKEYEEHVITNCYNDDIDNNICAEYLLKYAKDSLSPFVGKINHLFTLDTNGKHTYDNYLLTRLGIVKEVLNATTFTSACEIISNRQFAKMPGTKDDLKEQMNLFKQEFTDIYDKLENIFVTPDAEQLSVVANNVRMLLIIVNKVIDSMAKVKTNKGCYSFSDLEHFTYQMLCNNVVRHELQSTYQYIFFDEYQDINKLQDEILRMLSNNNLNLIGDVKQSIYEFRQSTPELFVEKYNSYGNGHGSVVDLSCNFRSQNNILKFVNMIFDKLITKQTLGIDYAPHSRLEMGKPEVQNGGLDRVELNLINKKSAKKTEEQEDIDYLQAEINLVVDKIKKYTSMGYEYKDIAVLVRERGKLVGALNTALSYNGIPCSMDIKVNIFDTATIQLLVNVLKVVNNYHDDIALSSVLLSKIVGLSESDLSLIAMTDGSTFYQKVMNYGGDNYIKTKINMFVSYLEELRHSAINCSPKELLTKVLDDYNLYTYYLSMPDGVEITSYIDVLLGMLSSFNSLPSALDYILSQSENTQNTKIIPGNKNHVTITTIHGSKGLEYNCVILCGAGERIKKEKNDNINISKKFGIGLKYVDVENRKKYDNFVKNACLVDNNGAIINEQIRLLYVALTRAKQQLCIIGTTNVKSLIECKSLSVYSCRNFLDLIVKGFEDYQVDNLLVCDSYIVNPNQESQCNCYIYDDYTCEENAINEIEVDKYDEGIVTELTKCYSYVYPHSDKINVATKNSVSSILSESGDYENIVEDMTSLLVTSVPNADNLALGTAYHAVMELVDYTSNNDIDDIVLHLVDSGIIQPAIAKRIDTRRISNAIESVRQLLKPDSVVLKEQQFTMRGKHSEFVAGGVDMLTVVQGVIDLAIVDTDGIILIDFKTNKTDENTLVNTYSKQLDLYSSALQKHYGLPIKSKMLYSFYLQKFVNI